MYKPLPWWVSLLLLAALYHVLGRVGLSLAHYQENATLIWPASGLALAALFSLGPRAWPGVFLGSLSVNIAISMPAVAWLPVAAGNTIEPLVAVLVLQRMGFDRRLSRLRDVLQLLGVAVVATPTLSATLGVGGLAVAGSVMPAHAGATWMIWWLGDAGGVVTLAPFLLVVRDGTPRWSLLLRRPEAYAALALLLATLVVSLEPQPLGLAAALVCFPVLAWVGVRLGPRGAVVGALLTGLFSVVAMTRGQGPFVAADPNTSMVALWAFVSTVGAVAMVLAAAVAEGNAAEAARLAQLERAAALQAQLQHSQRLEGLGLLAGGIAHDFNNLLAVIRGKAELARLEHPRLAGAVADIEIASDRASELCEQLLTYAGHNAPRGDDVDLDGLVVEMAQLMRVTVPRQVTLDVRTDRSGLLLGDPSQVRQVVLNLVKNAADVIGQRSGTIRMRTGRAYYEAETLRETYLHADLPGGTYLFLEVSDDGGGIAPEVLPRLFDPFFTTKGQGRGLGLAAVLGIVQAHGGAVKVANEGKGATFRVLLPPSGASSRIAPPSPPPRPAGKPGTILVADDEEQVREVIVSALQSAGWRVFEAGSGPAAVQALADHRADVDLVLLDMHMPGCTGAQALAEMRAGGPVKAVITSGYDRMTAGGDPDCVFLRKPFRIDDLMDSVAAAMAR